MEQKSESPYENSEEAQGVSVSEHQLENLKANWAAESRTKDFHFNETLSAELFFAMAPNLSDKEFVEFSAPIFIGREFQPSESTFHINELASLRISRNEYLSILRYSEGGKRHSNFSSPALKFWRLYRFILKATHRVPRVGPKICRILELPRLLLIISRLPRRLEELEEELTSLKQTLHKTQGSS